MGRDDRFLFFFAIFAERGDVAISKRGSGGWASFYWENFFSGGDGGLEVRCSVY